MPTPLPEMDVARVRRWCAGRVPEQARDQVRVECEVGPRDLTVVDRRAPWHEDLGADWSSRPVARMRYVLKNRAWELYWTDRNQRFHRYDRIQSTADINVLLAELDHDPTRIFWG